MKVIIVGGGISGLACGIYLAKSNVDVTIYEKNHYSGGFLNKCKRKNISDFVCKITKTLAKAKNI